eukprot:Em0004g832a
MSSTHCFLHTENWNGSSRSFLDMCMYMAFQFWPLGDHFGQGKEKVQKGRLKVTQSLEKLQHSQRQEQRKEDKKKAEKEMLNEPDPEKTRKWEEKEHKKP